jgi:hypothetical protein
MKTPSYASRARRNSIESLSKDIGELMKGGEKAKAATLKEKRF